MDNTSEDSLVAQSRRRGSEGERAFALLVEAYRSRLVGLTTNLLRSRGDGEDVAQEALVRAYMALPKLHQSAPFWPWLRTIAVRLAYNHRRDRTTRTGYEQKSVQDAADGGGPGTPAVAARQALDQALTGLAYPYREVLILRYVEGLSIGEIAAQLRLGESATKMRLARARDDFKAEYERVTR